MDITSIAGSVAASIVGIGAVSTFLIKTVPKIAKYVRLATEALGLVDSIIESLEDGQLSPEEVKTIVAKADVLRIDLKTH